MPNRREEMDRDHGTKQFRVYFRSDKSSLVSEERLGTLVKIIQQSTQETEVTVTGVREES